MGSISEPKKKKKLLGIVPRAHEARIFRIPKPIICSRASLFAEEEFSFSRSDKRNNPCGRTDGRMDGCVNSRHLSCSGSNLRTLSLEPPTPVAR